MRKLKFKLDRKSFDFIYTAFIRPLLEYGDVIIWDNCAQYEQNAIEKLHLEATRTATGTAALISINALHKEKRRNNHTLTLFFKMNTNVSPWGIRTIST